MGFWEDVNVANCLKKSTPSIVPYDTRDPLLRLAIGVSFGTMLLA